ncbi:MAG: response regulator transcription factor [Deltaproteobacteria bacterium]|nr:response regulator transcription factor [Deltaproteobacteria bacterium]
MGEPRAGQPIVLIVDDEPAIRESLHFALARGGFDTRQASSLAEARPQLDRVDLVVLDLMLPDGNGLDLLREAGPRSSLPVIVLTSCDDEADRVVGLELGADDYVVKPFSPREVVARVRSVLRRCQPIAAGCDEVVRAPGALRLDLASRRARCGSAELALSRTEFDLLVALARAPGRVFERGQLMTLVWGPDCVVSDRTVDVHIKALRKKLAAAGGEPALIETVRGVGYRLRGEGA